MDKCKTCKYAVEYQRYKTLRKDGNNAFDMRCHHPLSMQGEYGNKKYGRHICTYRPFGSLRLGKDNQIKTKPRWCPLIHKEKEE